MSTVLLTYTDNPLKRMYVRARGTTTSRGFAAVDENPIRFMPRTVREAAQAAMQEAPGDVRIPRAEMIRLVGDAIESGHLSVTRGVTFEFAHTVSRSQGRQMLRSVVGCAWEEMSQRFVKLLDRRYLTGLQFQHNEFGQDPILYGPGLIEMLEEAFVVPEHVKADLLQEGDDVSFAKKGFLLHEWAFVRQREVGAYLDEIEHGAKAEDARENLPNCTKTQMISTWSFEALRKFLSDRLCTRAQEPIRRTAREMRKLVVQAEGWMAPHLGIKCTGLGICNEAHPQGCPLLRENGGRVLRQSEALEILAGHRRP